MGKIVTVKCPSGLEGTVRGMKVSEANLFSDRKIVRKGKVFDKLLESCWQDTIELGPYEKLDWSQALTCDRFWALLMIREATYPGAYEFDVQCGGCGKPISWEVELSELPYKKLPDESAEKIASGHNKFEAQLSDGKKVFFRLQTGAGERRSLRLLDEDSSSTLVAAVSSRVIEIQGVVSSELRSFINDLDLGELLDLVEQFDEADGGVETDIEIECEKCGNVQEVTIPLGPTFYLPRRRKTRR